MDQFEFQTLLKLGKFTNEIKKNIINLPKTGTNILEIIETVENQIFEAGYLPAFPCTICINEQAAHFTVYDEEIILKKGDLVKIDFGVSFKGIITDTAVTIEIDDNKHEILMKTNRDALEAAIETIEIGISISKIGKSVNEVAEKNKFNTIHNLSGHEISTNNLHSGLQIPNYDNNSKKEIQNNSEIAIEPFLTYGEPLIKEDKLGNILHLKEIKPLRDPIAKNVLKYIEENFPKLPFSKRWLLKKFDKQKVNYAVKILKRENIIYEYRVLVSSNNSLISQFEDTVVFYENKKTIITRL